MDSGSPAWDLLPHGSDIGVRGHGATIEEAFEQAALALTAIVTDPEAVQTFNEIRVECEAPDRELLLAEWLNAVIYEMAVGGMLFRRFEVSIDDNHLSGAAWGEPVDVGRHQPVVEPKGATYTGLRVAREVGGGWSAECVVDV